MTTNVDSPEVMTEAQKRSWLADKKRELRHLSRKFKPDRHTIFSLFDLAHNTKVVWDTPYANNARDLAAAGVKKVQDSHVGTAIQGFQDRVWVPIRNNVPTIPFELPKVPFDVGRMIPNRSFFESIIIIKTWFDILAQTIKMEDCNYIRRFTKGWHNKTGHAAHAAALAFGNMLSLIALPVLSLIHI